jgi:hypothetical protein
MQSAPTQTTDTTDLGAPAEINAAVSALTRLLGEAAARECVAMQDEPTESISHDQAEQDPTVVDGA